ncbi:sulfatase-like hydrolase/transferase [Daejeonella sp.]|uniref:sulfatase-like hydrolase/transferase n=1 Tax=Daejeonella sp. TaxID=2805397 RepID=UPI0026BF092B|nr:sulfatase-like hydrolase/transferase [Daejeonella sp.]HQS04784.1 sulfatase-like hydrolase/transferase [Daejeonella sp.]HQT22231.1 sulfatase-like hydrolase/transferase [Daejeonella sp.]HQT57538.1 sulfatase-like hydrolase/transferase [Daejeonella sp.]
MSKITLLLCTTILWVTSNIIAQNSKPNIILIYIDNTGFGDIGITEANAYQTPNFNQLQKEGIFFTQFYSAQAICAAPGSGLLSGTIQKGLDFRVL